MKSKKSIFKVKLFLGCVIVLFSVSGILTFGARKVDAAVGSCATAHLTLTYDSANKTLQLDGYDDIGDWNLCLYNPKGDRVTLGADGVNRITATATVDGKWKGGIAIGHSCSDKLSTAGDCITSATEVTNTGNSGDTGDDNNKESENKTDTGYTNGNMTQVTIPNFTGTDDFKTLVENILKWVLSMAGGVALLMIIYGGIIYISSTGDQQKADQGKKIITWTIMGLLVILLSYSIIAVIDKIFVK